MGGKVGGVAQKKKLLSCALKEISFGILGGDSRESRAKSSHKDGMVGGKEGS